MSFSEILGHERPIKILRREIENQKVAHSYLFWGNEGIGKKKVAIQFAKVLNCLGEEATNGDSCDRCLPCRKIDQQIHPDVSLIEPEGQTLKIDQVRQMQRALSFRPYEGRYRVLILEAADRMAPNMSNSLLKTLEEPPLHTVIILLANNPRLILPTILSRCQILRFDPLPISVVSRWLLSEKGIEEKEAHILASLSEGSPGKAIRIQEEIRQIPREKLLRDWVGSGKIPFSEKELWAQSLPSEREDLLLILEIAKTLLRDLIVIKTTKNEPSLIHTDLFSDMKNITKDWSLSSLINRFETLHNTILAIKANANTRLSLEAMMLSWAEG